MPLGGMQCGAPLDGWTAWMDAAAEASAPPHGRPASPVRRRAPYAGAQAFGLAGSTCRPAASKTIVRRAMRATCWR